MNFKIIVDTDIMERSKMSGTIVTLIYCKLGEVAFPDENWTDFTLIILSWWLEATQKLLTGSSNREVFNFGSYRVSR